MSIAHDELARVVREHAGRLAASLMHLLGDFATAEDLVQDAIEAALQRWPVDGIPDRPDAWLFTVARRRGLDVLRRQIRHRDKLAQLQWPVPAEPDDRLRLIFTCCHPALSRQAQIALTLRVVCGLTTAQIPAAFLVPESTSPNASPGRNGRSPTPGSRTESPRRRTTRPPQRGPHGCLPAVQRGLLVLHPRAGALPGAGRGRRVAGVLPRLADAPRT
jgi:DNA-directed RNA polymerase specialized sigma24 family protein